MTSRQLAEATYSDLRITARRLSAHERPGHLLEPEALVHEAWLRLASAGPSRWQDPDHFRAAATRHMRCLLIDHSRQFRSAKRGGGLRIGFDEAARVPAPEVPQSFTDLHDLLDRLHRTHAESARVVRLRFFIGLTDPEIAVVLGCSSQTVRRRWRFAKAWLTPRLSHVSHVNHTKLTCQLTSNRSLSCGY